MTTEKLLRKFYLLTHTYKSQRIEDEDLYDLIIQEKFWGNIDLTKPENTSNKDFFGSKSQEEKEEHLKFGVACCLCFIQCNFTGPGIPESVKQFLASKAHEDCDYSSLLSINNEDISVNTQFPILLVVSKLIFDCCHVNNLVNSWWHFRSIFIHQELLDELSPTLLAHAERLIKQMENEELEGYIKAELHIEFAQTYLKFTHITKSKEFISSASNILGINYSFVGQLGKRTKFQVEELAQLLLEVKLDDKEKITRPEVEELTIPPNYSLNDEVRLDHVELSKQLQHINLPNTEQKLLLTVMQQRLISSPSDDLRSEEISSFLDFILQQKNTYSVRVLALLLRCNLECKNKRTIERCLKQQETIISWYDNPEPSAMHRIGDVFSTSFPLLWAQKAGHADTLLSFGLVKSGLKIYEEIGLWENVIVCYTILNKREKVAEIIKKQMEIKPTVKLMCLLGDATDDITCYERAWETSKRRSHRAQKHWGQFLFVRKKFSECIPHFEKSLSINPLQSNVWLALGFAALEVENWQTAATAYRRYTTLEPDEFEAWNNLAQAYIKLGNNRSAHQAILEALKCNFDNWKVWENLLVISGDVGKFSDVIRAYHRLLDLKGKYLNLEMLSLLVYGVCNDAGDAEGNPSGKYLDRCRELMGRVTGVYPNDGALWELYASLAPDLGLRANRLLRAYGGYCREGWEKEVKRSMHVLNVCVKLGDLVLDDEIKRENPVLNSARLSMSAALAAVKKNDWEETKDLASDVEQLLVHLGDKIENGTILFPSQAGGNN